MVKAVDLLSYWMPVLRNLKEFKEIAKAEKPEIEQLLGAIERTINNWYIETADADGLKRFEKILGILPKNENDIETRRFNVLVKWNDNPLYTDATLESLLAVICGGADRYKIERDYANYKIRVTTTVSVSDAYSAVNKLLSDILPCNLALILSNKVECAVASPLSVGIATNTAMCYRINQETAE